MHFQLETKAVPASVESSSFSGYVYTYAACRITHLSMRTMRLYAQKGVIRAIRRGKRRWMFKVIDLYDFNERRAVDREVMLRSRPRYPLRVPQHPQGKSREGYPLCWRCP